MNEYGNQIVVKGRIPEDKMDFYRDLALKDAQSNKDYKKFKNYRFLEEYKIYPFDEHVIAWRAND